MNEPGQAGQGPDFVGIGTTRGGSSWFWHVMASHPETWVTPIKELHYFDKRGDPDLYKPVINRHLKRRAAEYVKGQWNVNGDGWRSNLAWDLQYFLGRRSLEWYASLFQNRSFNFTGEVTPAYAILEKDSIADLASINPDVRAIYLLRDPIDRGWSSIVNGLAKKKRRSIEGVPVQEIRDKMVTSGFLRRSDYVANLERWRSVLGDDQVFVGFFEDIQERPAQLIEEIGTFLGLTKGQMPSEERLYKPANSTSKYSSAIPRDIERELAEMLYPKIVACADLIGGRAREWLERADSILVPQRSPVG